MNEAASLLLKHTDFQCFSKVNTDVNTFDCSIFEAHWKQENGTINFYHFGQLFFKKYGSFHSGNFN